MKLSCKLSGVEAQELLLLADYKSDRYLIHSDHIWVVGKSANGYQIVIKAVKECPETLEVYLRRYDDLDYIVEQLVPLIEFTQTLKVDMANHRVHQAIDEAVKLKSLNSRKAKVAQLLEDLWYQG